MAPEVFTQNIGHYTESADVYTYTYIYTYIHTGTVRYMAPEVFTQNIGHYTESADVYSAGLIMWYIASGKRPDPPDLEKVKAGVIVRPDIAKAKWPELGEIMSKCWAHEPAKRISATAAVAMLKALPDAQALSQMSPAPASCCSVS
jgi:serine/threonine protein kinase